MLVDLTMEQRLERAGIKTLYPKDYKFSRHETRQAEVKLKYNGKEIYRPSAQRCVETIKKEFGLEI